MSKGPTQLPPNPFSRPDTLGSPTSPRSAYGGFSDGVKVDTPGMKVTHEEMIEPAKVNDPNAKAAAEKAKNVAPDGKSAVAGFDQGSPASTKKIDSADFPTAKANPFDRKPKPASLRPEATQASPIKSPTAKSESPFEKKSDGPNIVTTSKGLEVTQMKTQDPDEFAQRLKQAQKPVTAEDIKEVTTQNYTKVYELKEKEKIETKKAEQVQAAELRKAEEASNKQTNDSATRAAQDAQIQMAKNATLAHQARELQGKMANLRGQLGQGGDDAATWAAIDECRIALAQIPSGLQG